LRKRKKRRREAVRRRANGARPHSESLSATKPWEALGMSRRTWYRRRSGTVGTDSCPVDSIHRRARSCANNVVPVESQQERGLSRGLRPKEGRGHPCSHTATIIRVYESMPVAWRLLALGLPLAA